VEALSVEALRRQVASLHIEEESLCAVDGDAMRRARPVEPTTRELATMSVEAEQLRIEGVGRREFALA